MNSSLRLVIPPFLRVVLAALEPVIPVAFLSIPLTPDGPPVRRETPT